MFCVFFVLFCVFVFERAILSWCPWTWHFYIDNNIFSLNISLMYIQKCCPIGLFILCNLLNILLYIYIDTTNLFILDSCKHYAVLESNATVGAAHVLTSSTVPRASLCAKLCNEHGACSAFSVLQSLRDNFECTLGNSTNSLVYQNGPVLFHLL